MRVLLRWLPVIIVLFAVSCEDLLDFTPPEVHILIPRDTSTVFSSVDVAVRASDNRRVQRIELLLNDSLVQTAYRDTLGVELNLPDSGHFTLRADAYDVHGNLASDHVQIRNVGENRAPYFEPDSVFAPSFPSKWLFVSITMPYTMTPRTMAPRMSPV